MVIQCSVAEFLPSDCRAMTHTVASPSQLGPRFDSRSVLVMRSEKRRTRVCFLRGLSVQQCPVLVLFTCRPYKKQNVAKMETTIMLFRKISALDMKFILQSVRNSQRYIWKK